MGCRQIASYPGVWRSGDFYIGACRHLVGLAHDGEPTVVAALDTDAHANLAHRFLDQHIDFLRWPSEAIREHGGLSDGGSVVYLMVQHVDEALELV